MGVSTCEFPWEGRKVLDGGGLELGGHGEGPPCWAVVLVEGWGEGRGRGTYLASWQVREHRKAYLNDPETVLGGICYHGAGLEVGGHEV